MLNRRRLGLESLEARQMMAGNVTVNVVQSLLEIVGDGAANSVVVESVAGGYRVRGTPFNGAFAADGTPLAGVAVTRLNGGNAAIVKAATAVNVVLNAGNDAIEFSNGFSGRSLTLNSGAGRDSVHLPRFAIDNSVNIRTGTEAEADADLVRLGIFGGSGLSFSSALKVTVNTGGGNDRVLVDSFRFGNLTVNLGGGADTLRKGNGTSTATNTLINTGSSEHRDVVELDSLDTETLTLAMGAGNDLFLIEDVIVIGLARVDGGTGRDEIRFANRNSIAREQETISIEIGNWPFPPNV